MARSCGVVEGLLVGSLRLPPALPPSLSLPLCLCLCLCLFACARTGSLTNFLIVCILTLRSALPGGALSKPWHDCSTAPWLVVCVCVLVWAAVEAKPSLCQPQAARL